MARYCFYCNRELAAGERCNCREQARRRQAQYNSGTYAPPYEEKSSQESRKRSEEKNTYSRGEDTAGDSQHSRNKRPRCKKKARRWKSAFFEKISPASLFRIFRADLFSPYDGVMDSAERPSLALSGFWFLLYVVLFGTAVSTFSLRLIPGSLPLLAWFYGALIGALIVGALLLIIAFFMRRLARETMSPALLFTKARAPFTFLSLCTALAALTALGSPFYAAFLLMIGFIALSAGLLAPIRANSPLSANAWWQATSIILLLFAAVAGLLLQILFRLLLL
jgi:hypothetical protein